jgi:hypothetical protein
MSGNAVLENVRRYRAIASLYRQTAAFRPLQSHSLIGEAERWEHLALSELEVYFSTRSRPHVHEQRAFWSYRAECGALAVAA